MKNEEIINKIARELPIRLISIFLICITLSLLFKLPITKAIISTLLITSVLIAKDFSHLKNRGVKKSKQ